jgi:plasmid maintenance system antidote protein VapI
MPNKAAQNVHYFLDSLLIYLNARNDAALARKIGVSPPALSKLRHHRLPVTPALMLKLYDVTKEQDGTGLTIEQLRELLYHPLNTPAAGV